MFRFHLKNHQSHSDFCVCSHCFETCCGAYDPKWEIHLSEQVKQLLELQKLNAHREAYEAVDVPGRLNTYERYVLLPFMSNKWLADTIMEIMIPNASNFVRRPATYDEALISVWLPLLIERLRED